MPSTWIRSSTERNGPFCSRYAMIRVAMTSPILGKPSSSSAVAVLMLILTRGSSALVASSPRRAETVRCAARGWKRKDHDQLAVAKPAREIHRREVRFLGQTTRCRDSVLESSSRRKRIDSRSFNLPPHLDDDRQGGRSVLNEDWRRGPLVQCLEERVDGGNSRDQGDHG